MSDRLCFLAATALTDGYRAGRFSPVAVTEAHLARIAALDAVIHAFTEVFVDEARAAARAAADRYAADAPRGPLDGVPVAVKDLIEIAGKACAAGSATRRGWIARTTAPVVTRLEAAGAVILGKTHTVEFALGGWGTNAHLGSPRNPWVSQVPFTAGGSSSGSAAAVAARMATLAIGTDTGGSVRVPAGFNGLVGLKTTPGRISLEGVVPLSPTLDTVGPIARTVADAALLYDVLRDTPPPLPTVDVLARGVAGMTLGRVGAAELDGVDAEITAHYLEALRALEARGARIVTPALPRPLADYQRDSEIMMAEAYALYGALAEDPASPMDPAVRARVLTGRLPAQDYIRARWRADADKRAMLAAMAGCDALLAPTARTLPIPLSAVDETTTSATLARFVNQIGFCALAVPSGMASSGLPTSLQIVCRPDDEPTALAIGRACEAAIPFAHNLPSLALLEPA